MPRQLSVESVIDKNKITSDVAWVILLDVEIVNPNTREVVEVIRVARNDEEINFGGQYYSPGNFDIQISQRKNEDPNVTISAQDQTMYIQSRLEAYAGGVLSNVKMQVVNSLRLDRGPEMVNIFQVTNSSVKDYVVSITLGAENPLNIQFPKHTQRQDRCAWRYKGYGCAYVGSMPTCDYSRDGDNGCAAHANLDNFRALTGLVRMNL